MPQITGSPCPKCGVHLDGCNSVTSVRPLHQPGDLSFCLHCATMLQFDDALEVKLVTPEQLAEYIKAQPDLALIIARVEAHIAFSRGSFS
jgi:hypothetical protein